MATEKRTRLSPEQRRAQLIQLGVEMLATRTLDELSVEDIAHEAGISRGLLFHYFSSKQDFHIAVVRAAAAELIARTAPDPDLSPVDALRGALTAYVEYVEQNLDSYTSLVRGAASGDGEMRTIFDTTRATMAARTIAVVEDLGVTMGETARLAVHGWVAFGEECVLRFIGNHAVSRDELLDLLTQSLPALIAASAGADVTAVAAALATQAPARSA